MSVIICVAMRRILENTRNNEKKSFSQGISVYNIEKNIRSAERVPKARSYATSGTSSYTFLARTIESKS